MFKNRIRHTITILVLFLVIIAGVGVVVATSRESAPLITLLWLNPANPVAVAGGSDTIDLQLDSVTNVFGAEVNISYDPAILSVPAGGVTPGACPQPDFVVSNTAAGGVISYAVTELNPTPPCNGGVVATIEFECSAGLVVRTETDILITSSIISDPNGQAIPHDIQHATFTCEVDRFFIEGSVGLQAWPDPSGVVVTLIDQATGYPEPVTVEPSGAFQIQGRVNHQYDVVAEYDRFLSPLETGITSGVVGSTVDIGLATMPAGDLNGDGRVNILDISVVAGNFGKQEPVPWSP